MLPTPLYTTQEVATELGVEVETVRRWVREGRIRAMSLGRDYRFSPKSVLEFVVEREKEAETRRILNQKKTQAPAARWDYTTCVRCSEERFLTTSSDRLTSDILCITCRDREEHARMFPYPDIPWPNRKSGKSAASDKPVEAVPSEKSQSRPHSALQEYARRAEVQARERNELARETAGSRGIPDGEIVVVHPCGICAKPLAVTRDQVRKSLLDSVELPCDHKWPGAPGDLSPKQRSK